MDSSTPVALDALHQEIRSLIDTARTHVVSQVNQALVLTYWHVGNTIRARVLMDDRAGYGDETVKRLAERLVQEFGSGFGQRNLFRMVKFTQHFPDMEILSTLSTKLSWSHFVEVFKIDDPLKREFYVGMCASEGWSVRMLRQSMDSMLYERTAISRQPEMVVRRELADLRQNRKAGPQLFLRDPYLLNFLDLADDFTEKDLENAILMDLERNLPDVIGKEYVLIMGCFDIGVSRVLSASIEQNNDANDMIYPPFIEPFEVTTLASLKRTRNLWSRVARCKNGWKSRASTHCSTTATSVRASSSTRPT